MKPAGLRFSVGRTLNQPPLRAVRFSLSARPTEVSVRQASPSGIEKQRSSIKQQLIVCLSRKETKLIRQWLFFLPTKAPAPWKAQPRECRVFFSSAKRCRISFSEWTCVNFTLSLMSLSVAVDRCKPKMSINVLILRKASVDNIIFQQNERTLL
ncbi:hypothetical protein [Domibacillus antri]|uniref:hypothetical protein n=1 Tax=Domibacillus antri TaxID=1714264 RepID=UPI00117865A7|nr:hypothetical protein [Domibacillus antri]